MAPSSYKGDTEGQGGMDVGDSSFSARLLSQLSSSHVHATWFAHSPSTHFGLLIARQACQHAHAPRSPCRLEFCRVDKRNGIE